MIPSFNQQPPRPHDKAEFKKQLKELTSNMRQLKLDEKGALANIRLIDIVELAFGPGIDQTEVAKELTNWLIDAKSKNLVEASDIDAIQDLASKANITPNKRSTEIERDLDDVMLQIRHSDPKTALYDLREAIGNNDEQTIASILKHNSEAIKQSLKMKITEEGENPLHVAIFLKDNRFIEILTKHYPDEFKAAMLDKDNEGMTPLMAVCAVESDYSEYIELMAKSAPIEFGKALLIQDDDGNTPLHCASLKNLQIMEKYAPKQFIEASDISNNNNLSPIMSQQLNIEEMKFIFEKNPHSAVNTKNVEVTPLITHIKATRPTDYREKMDVFKTNKQVVSIGKEISKRLAASHAFSLAGVTEIKYTGSNNPIKLDLEGHFMPQWFHLMGKTLGGFQNTYPEVLTDREISFLEDNFEWNSMEKNPQEILDRIQKENLPTVVQAGFMDEKKEGASHAVTFLFWGNRLVVCNRSRDARVPVDMYHFDQTQLTPEILEEINNVRLSGSEEDYKRLIFTTLPKELTLTKTADDQLLEKASVLPYQKVGNCSYVSPITSVYALLLLSTLDLKKTSGHPETMATEALTKYMKWLGFQQIKILERLIEPLQDKKHPIEPDHRLIREALKNAFSLDLDEVVAKKLEDITTSYLSTLIPEEQELLKIECAVWKNLPKNPVLVTKMVSESG